MCGRNSQWLGPIRRKAEFGKESGGTPRPGGSAPAERKGFKNGARTR